MDSKVMGPTPGLRLTPEKREQLRRLTEAIEHGTARFITYEADLAARAFREIERLRAEMERRGAERVAEADITRHDLAFYQGALDAAFEECEQLERTLNLPPGVHTLIYTRLKQWESLLDKLGECLPDD